MEAGLYYFYRMVIIVTRMHFQNLKIFAVTDAIEKKAFGK